MANTKQGKYRSLPEFGLRIRNPHRTTQTIVHYWDQPTKMFAPECNVEKCTWVGPTRMDRGLAVQFARAHQKEMHS